MTFRGNGPLDTSGVSGGGGYGGRVAVGGGAGLVIVVIAALIFGVNPADILGGGQNDAGAGQINGAGSGSEQIDEHIRSCTVQKANSDTICRIVATTDSLNRVWPRMVQDWQDPKTVIFSGSVDTGGCGSASSAVGPFYCPGDQTVYIDPTFFDTLHDQLGGSSGPFAQEYVVAHEFGHNVQHLLGTDEKAQQMGSHGAKSGSVRLELQADCYAGVWAYHADKGQDAMLEPLTDHQIKQAITTARAIGDDKLSGANSDGWTHGSSAQRVRWFSTGYQSGRPASCDTFSTDDL
jgi:predicted metalloprotease